jgi:hypothetical protein
VWHIVQKIIPTFLPFVHHALEVESRCGKHHVDVVPEDTFVKVPSQSVV